MPKIPLDGEWKLTWLHEADSQAVHPDDLEGIDAPSVTAHVPGNVELDLQRAGVLPDPFFGDNIRLLRPYEFCEWWYSREFDVPEGLHVWELVFAGLDTIAHVWINGEEVGRSENMLIEQRFLTKDALRPGRNRIDVAIFPFMHAARTRHYDAALLGTDSRDEMLHFRKAAHMGGWDIMPRAISAGIWRSVWLEAIEAPNAFEQMYYWTVNTDAHGATLGVRYQFTTDVRDLEGLSLRFRGVCGGHTFEHEQPVEFVAGGCHIPVPGAQLWWPKGYGEANLYAVTVELMHEGRALAERVDRIGLRTLDVDRTLEAGPRWMPGPKGNGPVRYDEAPTPEAHFVIRVNGTPIMVKGANWVPLDAFHSRDAERVDPAVALFDDLGCNMIRCWGGNVYEDHPFFDLCDERGIMVWQDFAFACGRYPQTEDFLTKVRQEAESVIVKLRNHPSLALWCGDNEVDAVYDWDGLSPEHNRINREVLPQVVHRCDPRRHYVPSSPYIPPQAEGSQTPEQHLWGPRGYYKGPFYTHHSAHFIGEIGYHGCPNVSSIERFIPEDRLWPWQDNEMWRVHDTYHWRHDAVDRDRIRLMANQVREVFGETFDDLHTFALASQIVQAEAKKFFIESTRLRKWQTSGILWWNVIDGWPQFSDAIVDYVWGKKLAYPYIRRVQQPVCVIIGEAGSEKYHPVVVSNDSREDADVHFSIRDADTNEAVLEGDFTAPANENWQVGRIRTYVSEQRVFLIEWEAGGRRYGNHYLAGSPPFDLERYRAWLPSIAALEQPFDPGQVAR